MRTFWDFVDARTDKCSASAKLLTKGDNNAADDTELYARGQDYLERQDIIGSGKLPEAHLASPY